MAGSMVALAKRASLALGRGDAATADALAQDAETVLGRPPMATSSPRCS